MAQHSKSDLDWEALIGTHYEMMDRMRRGQILCEEIEGHLYEAFAQLGKLKALAQRTVPVVPPQEPRVLDWQAAARLA